LNSQLRSSTRSNARHARINARSENAP